MATPGSLSQAGRGALCVVAGAALLAALSACELPFSLGQPTTRALETGAADSMTAAKSFEITGAYIESSAGGSNAGPVTASGARGPSTPTDRWTIDLQLARPDTQHLMVSSADVNLEAIVLGGDAYFRGNQYLSQHMGSDPLSRSLVKAAGNAWWKGSAGLVPRLPDFTDGNSFRTTFLGTAVTKRTDHVAVAGVDAVDLAGPRADVFVATSPPYRVLRVLMKHGVAIDGISEADFRFGNFDRDFQIASPQGVIDFSNLSTLPPVYTVVSVDTSGCAAPCNVSALLKNLGGLSPAQAPSTITFTMTDAASGKVLGSCRAQVARDVGYNSTTTVGCTIGAVNGQQVNAAIVTATADNPGHA